MPDTQIEAFEEQWLLTPAQACQVTQLSERHIRHLIESRQVSTCWLAGQERIWSDDLRRFCRANTRH